MQFELRFIMIPQALDLEIQFLLCTCNPKHVACRMPATVSSMIYKETLLVNLPVAPFCSNVTIFCTFIQRLTCIWSVAYCFVVTWKCFGKVNA